MKAPNSPSCSLLNPGLGTVVGTLRVLKRGLACFHLCLWSPLLVPQTTSLSRLLLSGTSPPQSWCLHPLHEFLPLGGQNFLEGSHLSQLPSKELFLLLLFRNAVIYREQLKLN